MGISPKLFGNANNKATINKIIADIIKSFLFNNHPAQLKTTPLKVAEK